MKALNQFLTDFDWGELEILIFDMPPGTGDEAISIMQMLPDLDGIVIVTTPQAVSVLDTGKSLVMSRKMNHKVLGIIENMSSFKCSCGKEHKLFGEGGGEQMTEQKRLAEGFLDCWNRYKSKETSLPETTEMPNS